MAETRAAATTLRSPAATTPSPRPHLAMLGLDLAMRPSRHMGTRGTRGTCTGRIWERSLARTIMTWGRLITMARMTWMTMEAS